MAIVFDDVNRLITIESPEIEVTCQDLLNAIREFESSEDGIDNPQVATAAGKEPLGGGVLVGVTLTLLDWKVKFEDRPGPDWVYCNVSGGNLVSVDSVGSFQFPLEPAEYVMATITASSSATLSDLSAIQFSSYQNAAWIDTDSAYSGTEYPVGTREYPVNNLADAIEISNNNGFDHIIAMDDLTINSGSDLIGFTIEGLSHTNTTIDIQSTAEVFKATIKNCTISGILDGGVEIWNCIIDDLDYVYGHIHNCGLRGKITLDGGADAVVANCYTIDPYSPPEIDMGSSGQNLAVPNYSGYLTISNITQADVFAGIGVDSGEITIADTVTAGTVVLSGVGTVIDNSTGTAVINIDGLISKDTIASAVWDANAVDHLDVGTLGKLLTDVLEDTSTTLPAAISTMQTNITELLGLTGENVKWSNITHDVNSLMTSARITLYTDNTLTTPVKAWDIAATYSGGEITSYQMKEV